MARSSRGTRSLSHLRRLMRPDRRDETPGRAAGLNLSRPPTEALLPLEICDYGPEHHHAFTIASLEELPDVDPGAVVRWINLNTPHEDTLRQLGTHFDLHPLALEDVLHRPQRIRLDVLPDSADFMVLRMLSKHGGKLQAEQISIFIGPTWLITIQEHPGDVWGGVRDRLTRPTSRVRQGGVGTLLHVLMDTIVDHCFPIVDTYGEALEALESEALSSHDPDDLMLRLHVQRREQSLLRRMIWPLKPMLTQLRGHTWPEGNLTAYLQDVHEHVEQLLEQLELDRETVDTLMGLVAQQRGERLNEAMKWLAVLSSLFIPSSFLAGVFGMNFKYMPGADVSWGFWGMLGVSATSMLVMLWVLRRRRWI
ncbi:MAG: magnesium/cobalt transporter CorA [Bradymonadia bacterium]